MRLILTASLALLSFPALAHDLDLHRLPLGDGKISTEPKAGYIWACRIDKDAGGAFRDGPWIDKANGTYDFTAKPSVQGSVTWPHSFKMSVEGDQRIFVWNDLPDHPTGTFPIAPSDSAFQYDRNPNAIAEQKLRVAIAASPVAAPQPTCAPGAVGILLTGAVLFNALDAPGRDAVAHEIQDSCQGHPQASGMYHYHSLTSCIDDGPKDGPSQLIGYALDGFGIYGPRGADGKELTSADLDACHGITSTVMWEGKETEIYHYVATRDFPHTVGCMRGAYDRANVRTISGPPPSGPPPRP
jgi:hypothetical protein